jgi:hypothetical protein
LRKAAYATHRTGDYSFPNSESPFHKFVEADLGLGRIDLPVRLFARQVFPDPLFPIITMRCI